MNQLSGYGAGLVGTALMPCAVDLQRSGAGSEPAGPAQQQAPAQPQQPGQQQAPAQPQQPGQQQADEPSGFNPPPTDEGLQSYTQRLITPSFDGIPPFKPVPNVAGFYQVQIGDQALPGFFVNLVEEGSVMTPDLGSRRD